MNTIAIAAYCFAAKTNFKRDSAQVGPEVVGHTPLVTHLSFKMLADEGNMDVHSRFYKLNIFTDYILKRQRSTTLASRVNFH